MRYPAASTPDSCGQLQKAAIHPHHRKSQPSAATSTFAVSQGFGREPAEWMYALVPVVPDAGHRSLSVRAALFQRTTRQVGRVRPIAAECQGILHY